MMFTHFLCHPNQTPKKGIYPFTQHILSSLSFMSVFLVSLYLCLCFLSCSIFYFLWFTFLLKFARNTRWTRGKTKGISDVKKMLCLKMRESSGRQRVAKRNLILDSHAAFNKNGKNSGCARKIADILKKKKWQEVCWGNSLLVRRQEATWEETWQRKRAEGNTTIHLKHRITCDAGERDIKERVRKLESCSIKTTTRTVLTTPKKKKLTREALR